MKEMMYNKFTSSIQIKGINNQKILKMDSTKNNNSKGN